jgi:hypothetical protein
MASVMTVALTVSLALGGDVAHPLRPKATLAVANVFNFISRRIANYIGQEAKTDNMKMWCEQGCTRFPHNPHDHRILPRLGQSSRLLFYAASRGARQTLLLSPWRIYQANYLFGALPLCFG